VRKAGDGSDVEPAVKPEEIFSEGHWVKIIHWKWLKDFGGM
jgi:hypothetical protein